MNLGDQGKWEIANSKQELLLIPMPACLFSVRLGVDVAQKRGNLMVVVT